MKQIVSLAMFCALFFLVSCKKEAEIPPKIQFKTDAGYISADGKVAKSANLKAGISITKVEDELKTLNVSVAYDGATNTETKQKIDISGNPDNFAKDIDFSSRNQSGTEKWYFTVTDSDGNTAQVSLNLNIE
ncbi:MAG: hypothetical protein WCR52_07495 [Bacteroidota bacterium]